MQLLSPSYEQFSFVADNQNNNNKAFYNSCSVDRIQEKYAYISVLKVNWVRLKMVFESFRMCRVIKKKFNYEYKNDHICCSVYIKYTCCDQRECVCESPS